MDLDNVPHVPLFRPMLEVWKRRGENLLVTARNFQGTLELCRMWGIDHVAVGKHGGAGKIGKLTNLVERAAQLRRAVLPFKPDLAVSHGSRTQIVAAKWMGVPSIVMMDYLFTEAFFFKRLTRSILMPAAIPDERLIACGFPLHKVRRYNGFKEELYLPSFRPEPEFRASLNVPEEKILLTIRPSAIMANYHNPLSEQIVLSLLERALATTDVLPLVVSRTKADRSLIVERFGDRVRFLDKPVDGLQLIWASDVFVSGGGTMNREAALLGVPAYSIFTGRRPYLDEYLAAQGRLIFADSLEKVAGISLKKRQIPVEGPAVRQGLAEEVADMITQ
ncbi:MAG: DUF354 domain-containing protein [Kiritimatiellia bacterium]|nr:DUF354 domain-containing protein [Kiritimatiellia bacterium]